MSSRQDVRDAISADLVNYVFRLEAENARLWALVRRAYNEGWADCGFADNIHHGWRVSDTRRALEEQSDE